VNLEILFFTGALADELAAALADVPVHGSAAADRAFFRCAFLNFRSTALAFVARVVVFSHISGHKFSSIRILNYRFKNKPASNVRKSCKMPEVLSKIGRAVAGLNDGIRHNRAVP
jgi:hypothetical protein